MYKHVPNMVQSTKKLNTCLLFELRYSIECPKEQLNIYIIYILYLYIYIIFQISFYYRLLQDIDAYSLEESYDQPRQHIEKPRHKK